MKIIEHILVASLISLTLLSCLNDASKEIENEHSLFIDSLDLEPFREFIYTHYDKPLSISHDELNKHLEADSFVLKSLLWKNSFYYELDDYQFDSLLAKVLSVRALPKYEPHIVKYRDTSSVLRFYVDKRVFGRKDIEVIHIERKDGFYSMLRADIEVDDTCFRDYPQKYQEECIQVIDKQERTLEEDDFQEIEGFYRKYDLGRIAYYDHQSRIICDGFTYQLRRISNGTDKVSFISCPMEKNSLLLFHKVVGEYFDSTQ